MSLKIPMAVDSQREVPLRSQILAGSVTEKRKKVGILNSGVFLETL